MLVKWIWTHTNQSFTFIFSKCLRDYVIFNKLHLRVSNVPFIYFTLYGTIFIVHTIFLIYFFIKDGNWYYTFLQQRKIFTHFSFMQMRFPNIKEIWNFFIRFILLVVLIGIELYGEQKRKKPIHLIECVHKSTILKLNSSCKTQIYFTSGKKKNPRGWEAEYFFKKSCMKRSDIEMKKNIIIISILACAHQHREYLKSAQNCMGCDIVPIYTDYSWKIGMPRESRMLIGRMWRQSRQLNSTVTPWKKGELVVPISIL